MMPAINQPWFRARYLFAALFVAAAAALVAFFVPLGPHDFGPPEEFGPTGSLPLDPASPWPKFRADARQSGRSALRPAVDPSLKPWAFPTGKGIFSSPVIDADGTAYIGSADHWFYAIRADGGLKWKYETGEIIDSSGLLDDRGRVYFGSGDAHVYCLDRADGRLVWKSRAHTVGEVEAEFKIKTYNLDWFEGNVGMLPDGTLLAPNDNYLVYALDRDTGKRKAQYLGNELLWSLPAVNADTGRMFFGSQFMALRNAFAYDYRSGKRLWVRGGLGSNAASPLLTSDAANGAVVLGGFDGFVRAYSQRSGKLLWKRGVRDHIYASPASLSDGTIIQPSADGTLYALDPSTGRVRWAFDALEPIRSSPAVDALDRIYVGSGEGRLFCVNPDGTLRWAYRCIAEDRDDLNGSPGLGPTGVYLGGENGGVFFVPYDYPLTPAGLADPRCSIGPGEDLPPEGAGLVFTTRFGRLIVEAPTVEAPTAKAPESVDANQPLAFTLFVREKGDTVKATIVRDGLKVEASGAPDMRVDVSANGQFVILTPKETWIGPAGGKLTIKISGSYKKRHSRFGLKFFGGSKGGEFSYERTFAVAPRPSGPYPYAVPARPGDLSTVFEFSRLSAPNPTMLPSWNQIGFDSLHYLCGLVEGDGKRAVAWTVGGKLEGGATVFDPSLEARYPLILDYDGGLVTLRNYDGFKINFVGSWDMPFGSYRISSRVDPETGTVLDSAAFAAVALCDDIEYYGKFLKLMGMSEFDTGHMAVFGGLRLGVYGQAAAPSGAGAASFSYDGSRARVDLAGGSLRKADHVYGLLLVDEASGEPLPLYYTKDTAVEVDAAGVVKSISVSLPKGGLKGPARAYCMVDAYPAARGRVAP